MILEVGKKRRVVAGAMDWPGLDRWGISEDGAVAKLSSYLPRYVGVAERAGMGAAFARAREWRSSNVFRGRARPTSGASPTCRHRSSGRCCLRPISSGGSTYCVRPGPSSTMSLHASAQSSALGSRERWTESRPDHAPRVVSEAEQMSRKVEVRTPREVVLAAEGLAAHRSAYLEAIRAYNAKGKPARTWPIQFLVRRTANHVMDHAWEMEDRDLGSPSVS